MKSLVFIIIFNFIAVNSLGPTPLFCINMDSRTDCLDFLDDCCVWCDKTTECRSVCALEHYNATLWCPETIPQDCAKHSAGFCKEKIKEVVDFFKAVGIGIAAFVTMSCVCGAGMYLWRCCMERKKRKQKEKAFMYNVMDNTEIA